MARLPAVEITAETQELLTAKTFSSRLAAQTMFYSSQIVFFGLAALSMLTPLSAAQPLTPSQNPALFDVIIKGGTLYDGTGAEPKHVDLAIRGDRIAGIGAFKTAKQKTLVDSNHLAVAPEFINILPWSNESLIQDGRSQSEIRQGVTT